MRACAVDGMALKPVEGEFGSSFTKDDKSCGKPEALLYEFSGGGYVFCCMGALRAARAVRVLASSCSCKAS